MPACSHSPLTARHLTQTLRKSRQIAMFRKPRVHQTGHHSLDDPVKASKYPPSRCAVWKSLGLSEVGSTERHGKTMGLQVVRGRELKPPLREVRENPPVRVEQAIAKLAAVRKPALRFPVNPDTKAFYRRFYPGTSTAEWNDWRWQMRTRIRTLDELARIFRLSDDEHAAVERHTGSLPVGITPYYASLMGLDDRARAAAPHPHHDRRRICPRARRG